jgi:hypothetical protein
VRLADEGLCRAGLRCLRGWPTARARRIENAAMMEERLAGAGLGRWAVPREAEVVMLSSPVLVAEKVRIMDEAVRRGVHLLGYYETPVHPLWGEELAEAGYRLGSCPRAERLTDELVHVSTSAEGLERSAAFLGRFRSPDLKSK